MTVTAKLVVRWNGEEIERAALRASAKGINETMAACVTDARADAPVRSGKLKRSIRIVTRALPHVATLMGYWGSASRLRQVVQLYKRKTLRKTAEKIYPTLGERVRKAFAVLAPK